MDTDTEPDNNAERLRGLPSVERLASRLPEAPHHLAVAAARETIDAARQAARGGGPLLSEEELARAAAERLARLTQPSLRRVINATGVVLHTNLGRAPLAPAAVGARSPRSPPATATSSTTSRAARAAAAAPTSRGCCAS